MKNPAVAIVLLFTINLSYGQNVAEAEKMVSRGISLHDQGEFENAISRYDSALRLDADNLSALAEKAMSSVMLQRYDDAIALCERALKVHPGHNGLQLVYVTYGNALDGAGKPDKAIKMYDQGIKKFPDYYQLRFNKGITLSGLKKYDEALESFQQSALLNPLHASSHHAIARLTAIQNLRIPSILAYCRFLAIEPQGKRAQENFHNLQTLMNSNVSETEKGGVTINVSPDMLAAGKGKGKRKENNFSTADLMLAMSSGLDYDQKNKTKSPVENFSRKVGGVFSVLAETRKDQYGFYWEYYAPYFIEMKNQNLTDTFSYLAFASADDPSVRTWLADHAAEVRKFFEWSKSFAWQRTSGDK
jgi:tetratricopeptide (TPR) repeat protein